MSQDPNEIDISELKHLIEEEPALTTREASNRLYVLTVLKNIILSRFNRFQS